MMRRATPTWLLFSLGGLVWGSSFFLIKLSLTALNPAQLAVARLGFGVVALGIIMLGTRTPFIRDWALLKHIAVVGFFLAGLPLFLFAWVGEYLPSGVMAIFNATTPLFTLIIASIFLPSDRMRITGVLGILLGAAGLIIVVSPWQYVGTAALQSTSWLAYATALAATTCYAIGYTYLRKTLAAREVSPIAFTFAQISSGFVSVCVLAVPAGLFAPITFSWVALLAVATLGAIATGIAYIWNNRVVTAWGSVRASMVTYVTPVVGVLLGITFLGEPLTWNEPLGMLVLFAGIALAQGLLTRKRALN
ncbi:MAG: DMT family transporter [Agromyces sp.]